MFRFLVVSTLVALATSYSHGGYSAGGGYGHAVPAAVLSKHHVTYHDVHSTGHIQPTTIDVPPNYLPINFVFRSASSHIHVASKHEGAPGSHKSTYSHDEPHKLVHTVTKPIIQEVNEVITPYRRVKQTVEPVREEVQTIVARGHHHQPSYHKGGYESAGGEMAEYGRGGEMGGVYSGMAYGKY